MRRQTLVALLGIALLAGATAAWAQSSPLELSPWAGPYDGRTLEVPPGEIEQIWFHITEPGLWHVSDISFHYQIVSTTGEGAALLIDPIVKPSIEYQGSVWYPFGMIQVLGIPSTTFAIQIDLVVQGGVTWLSNPIYKHITPEPSSLLALGTGALGVVGLILRRRRS